MLLVPLLEYPLSYHGNQRVFDSDGQEHSIVRRRSHSELPLNDLWVADNATQQAM